jgi:glycosyltransferase involved in cell wall biosynthesis
MKVLHVIPSISPIRGGPSQAVIEMVGALRQEGIDAEIATTNDNADLSIEIPLSQRYELPTSHGQSIPIYCFNRYESSKSAIHEYTFSVGLTRFLWQNIKTYDLVHIHAIFSYPSTAAMAIARLYNVPYLIRPLGSLCQWSLEQSKKQKEIYLSLTQGLLNHSHGIHFTATPEKEEAKALGLTCPNFILPLGLEISESDAEPKLDLRSHFKITNTDPILLFLSRIHPKKGIEPLLEALSQLNNCNFNLILAGSGDADYESKIQQLIADKELTSRVHTIGFVQGSLKKQLLQGSDLFVLTSYSENFGIVVLEALAFGTPTLITSGVALAEWVKTHDLGWVCEPENDAIGVTIEQALSNPAELAEKGKRAEILTRKYYSWSVIAQKLARQYQEAIASSDLPLTLQPFSTTKNA